MLGSNDEALRDAELSLEENKDFHKVSLGLSQLVIFEEFFLSVYCSLVSYFNKQAVVEMTMSLRKKNAVEGGKFQKVSQNKSSNI